MSIIKLAYNAIFKRSSTFSVFIIAGAFLGERIVDYSADCIFEKINEGKLWHHIKPAE
ncbi:UNVERIFIED_CONTAM: hypothetical protein PYX00_009078 [Menopon gallinae]|uniref:Complex III subunit 9 n=1 Tax=Menopon gallinae TaxID=328185 RepID=A0AAW2H9V1_9NEOP